MTRDTPQYSGSTGWFWRSALMLILLGLVTAYLAACGDDGGESFTPPPATIIRASEDASPTSTVAQPASPTPLPMPPTRPPRPTVARPAEGHPYPYPYPMPVHTPRFSPTPVVYPTK